MSEEPSQPELNTQSRLYGNWRWLVVTVVVVLIQAYLWAGFFLQEHRLSPPVYTVILDALGIAVGIGMVIRAVLTRRSIWLISGWLALTFSQLVVNFSYLYWGHGSGSGFTSALTHLDAMYFTVGTLSTAGTGNIAPISETARGLQTLQNVLDLGLVVFAVSLFASRVSGALSRPDLPSDSP